MRKNVCINPQNPESRNMNTETTKKAFRLSATSCALFAIACALVFASGCATQVGYAELAAADCGVQPTDAATQAGKWLKANLKDYDSARIEFAVLEKDYSNSLRGRNIVSYGWMLPAKVNAKNGFGGYAGWRDYQFYFHEGRLALVRERDEATNRFYIADRVLL